MNSVYLELDLENHLCLYTSRVQAIAIGQALVDGRWLECVSHHDQLFRDEYALYRPLQVKGLGKLLSLLGFAARIFSDPVLSSCCVFSKSALLYRELGSRPFCLVI